MSYGTNMIRLPLEEVEQENDLIDMKIGESLVSYKDMPFGIYYGHDADSGIVWVRI